MLRFATGIAIAAAGVGGWFWLTQQPATLGVPIANLYAATGCYMVAFTLLALGGFAIAAAAGRRGG